jgi:hypothetical protein
VYGEVVYKTMIRGCIDPKDPLASPARVRRAMLLRLYGHEFRAEERERILTRLGRDS